MHENKTKYMRFKGEGAISTQRGEHLRLVDKFTYFSSSVSSIEDDVNIRLAEAWVAIDSLSII